MHPVCHMLWRRGGTEQTFRPRCAGERLEHERDLDAVCGAHRAAERRRTPAEIVEMGPAPMLLGEAARGPTEDQVGQRRGERLAGLHLAQPVRLQHLVRLGLHFGEYEPCEQAVDLGLHAGRHEIEVHLLPVGADQQLDLRARALTERLDRRQRHHIVAMHGQEAAEPVGGFAAAVIAQIDADRRLAHRHHRIHALIERGRGEARAVGRHPHLLGDLPHQPLHDRDRARHPAMSALDDRAAEQPFGERRSDQRSDRHRAGRFAEHRDVGGIAAERRDIVAHPLQGENLVAQAEVCRAAVERQETFDAEAIIDRDADHARSRKGAAVMTGAILVAEYPGAAMNEHHDRKADTAALRRPYV